MRMEITKTTVESAIALGEKLNQLKVASAAIEMTGDIVVLTFMDARSEGKPEL